MPTVGRNRTVWSWLDAHGWLVAIAIFLISFAVRLVIAVATHAYVPPAYGEIVSVARSVVDHGTFSNPHNTYTGPTAHVAPVYVGFLALVLKLVPFGPSFSWAIILIGAAGASFVWSLLPACAVRLGIDRRVGLLAGLFGAIYPFRHHAELQGQWEGSFAALAFMGLAILSLRTYSQQSDQRIFVWGVLWGAGMLLEPAFLSVFVVFLLAGCLRSGGFATAARHATIALIGMVVVILPWTIRNYRELGGLMFVRDDFGTAFSVSNNAGAFPHILENLYENPNSDDPDQNMEERLKVAAMGEVRYNKMRQRAALNWIAADPAQFLKLTARRAVYFWIPKRRSLVLSAIEGLISLIALLGLCTMLRRREKAAGMFAIIWLIYPLVYYLNEADERYRTPMEWCITLCAAYGFWNVIWRPRMEAEGLKARSSAA